MVIGMLATRRPEATLKNMTLVAALTMALSTVAHAQQQQPPQPQTNVEKIPEDAVVKKQAKVTVLSNVTVTAERVKSTVQDTPVAITALSAEVLAQRQVTDVRTAAADIPGVLITPSQGGQTNTRIFMRGVGQQTGGINFDTGVGIYIDNVYQPRITGAFFDFFDIQQLEVLRGPQGTLYGRNTSGGAMKIETLTPSSYWTGKGELDVGNWDARGVKYYVSGPLIEDKLAVSFGGFKRQRDGFIYSTAYGRRVGNLDRGAQRVKLLYTPNDKFQVEGSVFFIQDYSEAGLPVPLSVLPGINDPQANGTFHRDLTRTEIRGNAGQGAINNTGAAINARYILSDNVTLNSITGYGNLRSFNSGGTIWQFTANPSQFADNQGTMNDVFYSQEFNATYSSDSFRGVMGFYYFNESGKTRGTAAGSSTIDGDRRTSAPALFAQGTYQIGSGVGLTAGIRLTQETATFTQFYHLLFNASQTASKKFTASTPKLGVNWQANSNLLLYASWTQGFKSGGFNPIPPNANTGVPGQVGAPTPYNPETVNSYEIGAKFTAPNDRVRLNVAAYRAVYGGMQLPVFFPGTNTIYTSNATGGVVKGIELEPTWQVSNSLLLYGNAAFATSKYTGPFPCNDQFGARTDCQNRKISNLIPQKWTFGFRFTPDLPVLPGKLSFNASVAHNSPYFNNVANEGPLVGTVAASIYNARIGWTSPLLRWTVDLEGRNLANKHYSLAGIQLSNPVSPAVSSYPNPPREVMLKVGMNW